MWFKDPRHGDDVDGLSQLLLLFFLLTSVSLVKILLR